MGELAEAGRLIALGREIAREQGDDLMVGWTYLQSSGRGYLLGEAESTHEDAERGLEIAERIGDSFSRSWAWFFLGVAERMRGRWKPAIDALERSEAISRDHRIGVDFQPVRLAFLAESHLGLGDTERAREKAAQGVECARSQGNVLGVLAGSLAQARVLLGSEPPAGHTRIEAALVRALEFARRTGAKSYEPQIHVELAELARRSHDEEGRQKELREAYRLFVEIGASGYVERLAGEPALSPR
jgi:tetratricopeptide (TPR) repeat protein